LAATAVVAGLIALYSKSNPHTHLGSFLGNAIADWTGVLVTVVMTKYLYEKGSRESNQTKGSCPSQNRHEWEFFRNRAENRGSAALDRNWCVL